MAELVVASEEDYNLIKVNFWSFKNKFILAIFIFIVGFSIQVYQENDPNQYRYEMEATQILKLLQPDYFKKNDLYNLYSTMGIDKLGYFYTNAEFDVNLNPQDIYSQSQEIYSYLDKILKENGWEKDQKSKYPVLKYKNKDWKIKVTVKELKRYSIWLQRNENRLGF